MVKVNDVLYDAFVTTANDGTMRITFETDSSLNDIETNFAEGSVIEVIEGEETIAKYYNKKLLSITATRGARRSVAVIFAPSVVSISVETELREADEVQSGAIADLASTVSEMSESNEVTAEAFEELAAMVAEIYETVINKEAV